MGECNVATGRYQPGSLEARRAQRRRRARRRKKRIRALLLLILLIALIVFIIIAFASCRNKDTGTTGTSNEGMTVETTPEATAEPVYSSNSADSLIPPSEQENDLLDIIMDIDAKGAEKTAYLTFDDGPSPNVTPSILDTLRRYNVKATFFMLGTSINSYPDLARRVYEEGHLLANHSNGHNYETLYATEESFMSEVTQTEDIISNITNGDHNFKLFRFPGGSYNAGDHAAEKQIYKRTLAVNGFYHIDWNALNGDAEGRTKTAPDLLEYLQRNLDTESSAVILMHDAAAKTATAEGLAAIIEYLISEGYVFKRLDEMPYLPPSYADPYTSDGSTYDYGNGGYDEDYDNSDYYDNDDDDDDYGYTSSSYTDSSYSSSSGSYGSSGNSSSSGSSGSSSSSSSSGSSGNGLSGDGSIIGTTPPGSTTRTSVSGVSVTETD